MISLRAGASQLSPRSEPSLSALEQSGCKPTTPDAAYRRLIHHCIGFYREALFNDHWGEQAHFSPDNKLEISMVYLGLDT